jgi:MraZ protein
MSLQIDYFTRKLDAKNRLSLPAELKDEFSKGVVITKGFGQYLHLYTIDVWNEVVEPKLSGDILDEKTADLNMRFRLGQQKTKPDLKQGRITIDSSLLSFSNIKSDIIAVRVGQYWRLIAKELV